MGWKVDMYHQGVKESSRLYKIPVNELDIEEGQQILPLYVRPFHGRCYTNRMQDYSMETAIHSFQKIGSEYQCRFIQEKVIHIEYQNQEVKVKTDHDEYTANKIICCAGSWTHQFCQKSITPSVTRQMIAWVKVKDPSDYEKHVPLVYTRPRIGMLYGFPYWEKKKESKLLLYVPGEHTGSKSCKKKIKLQTILRSFNILLQIIYPGKQMRRLNFKPACIQIHRTNILSLTQFRTQINKY